MESLVMLSKEAYYAKKLGEAYCNKNPNVISVHKIPYYQRKLKEVYWEQFQQEQQKREIQYVNEDAFERLEKSLYDTFERLKK